jgi:hypothetical protein
MISHACVKCKGGAIVSAARIRGRQGAEIECLCGLILHLFDPCTRCYGVHGSIHSAFRCWLVHRQVAETIPEGQIAPDRGMGNAGEKAGRHNWGARAYAA